MFWGDPGITQERLAGQNVMTRTHEPGGITPLARYWSLRKPHGEPELHELRGMSHELLQSASERD